MMIRISYLSGLLFFCCLHSRAQELPAYKNRLLPVETRVKDLLGRMTPEEKFWQLFMIPGEISPADSSGYRNGIFGFQFSTSDKGAAGGQILQYNGKEPARLLAAKINRAQRFFMEQTRLGIPIIPFDEALHGLVREGATSFPQSIALAATWDTVLLHQVADIIAGETRQRGIRQVLSPVLNIAADPRWGRTEETYGEDPFLVSAMGQAFVNRFEKQGIITTPKHFIANVGDGGRDSYPIHINDRLLEEIYFPPFLAAIKKGGSRSLMTAYNSVNGTASSANSWLLTKKLKQEWGFSGFVISDANAVGGEVVLHNTARNYEESGIHAMNAGLDVIFQTEYKHHELFIKPFLDGRIDSNRINDAVSRVLRAKFELGLFENPYVKETIESNTQDKAIARKAALESMVLLKNKNGLLPVSGNIHHIAVIGQDATEARQGGYSGPAGNRVSILDGIRQRGEANIKVTYNPGCGRSHTTMQVIPARYLQHDGQPGLMARYYNNVNLTGEPFLNRTDQLIDFRWTLFGPGSGMDADYYSVSWTGTLQSPGNGKFRIGLEGNDGFRLYINNELIIDNWIKQSYHVITKEYAFEKNRSYRLRVEFYEPKGDATIKLVWDTGVTDNRKKEIDAAVAAAGKADLAVIVAGIEEGEFQDRARLALPGLQEEMIRAVAATGKPVVVLLVGGSAITMNQWIDQVGAVLMVWYPGEEGGRAVADVLFGDFNPAGRLPISFPVSEGQLPLVYNHKPTGRGDDYADLTGLPLFPFGYGLSYSRFAYRDVKLIPETIRPTDTAVLSFRVKNTGSQAGDEVIQLYIRDKLSSVARPVMELKGFQRVHFSAGEEKEIRFNINRELLQKLNGNMQWETEPGDYIIMIGASSADIRLKTTLTVAANISH